MYNIKNLTVMEKREIIVSLVKSNNSDNNVWAVSITGDEQPSAHCKTAYKAMRFMFLLKKQTGLYIAAESLAQLSAEIAFRKAEQAAGVSEASELQADEPKPKAKRKPRSKKSEETAAVPQ